MYNRIHILNTFTANEQGGNPTAIYLSRTPPDKATMQLMARELYVPVTAFVWPGKEKYQIRYFTARTEIAACGHATLGAATVLAGVEGRKPIVFETGNAVQLTAEANPGGYASMLYPAVELLPCMPPKSLLYSLAVDKYEGCFMAKELNAVFMELGSVAMLKHIKPDFALLLQCSNEIKEVVVMAASDTALYDYQLRSFCPWIGIDEDPVTGSVQAALAPYWGKKLRKNQLTAYQASGRGGEIHLRIDKNTVCISGQSAFLTDGVLLEAF